MKLLLRYLVLLCALLALSFALPRLLPGDPLAPLSAGNGQDTPVVLSAQARRQLMAYYGLSGSLPQQFLHFLGETAHGDLGFSIRFNQPVTQLIGRRALWTLALLIPSLLLSSVLGCLLGLWTAWRHNHRGQSHFAASLLLLGSLPDFVIGIILILLLGVWLRLLPTSGAMTPFQSCNGPAALGGCAVDIAAHAALPVLTLTAAQLPAFFLLMRASALAEIRQPYILAARARGMSEQRLALHHAGRNAIQPIVTLLGLRIGAMLGGVVVIETLFAYPGLGQMTFEAALARDFPLLQALFLLGGLAILLCNAAADLLRQRIDPRLRLEPAA